MAQAPFSASRFYGEAYRSMQTPEFHQLELQYFVSPVTWVLNSGAHVHVMNRVLRCTCSSECRDDRFRCCPSKAFVLHTILEQPLGAWAMLSIQWRVHEMAQCTFNFLRRRENRHIDLTMDVSESDEDENVDAVAGVDANEDNAVVNGGDNKDNNNSNNNNNPIGRGGRFFVVPMEAELPVEERHRRRRRRRAVEQEREEEPAPPPYPPPPPPTIWHSASSCDTAVSDDDDTKEDSDCPICFDPLSGTMDPIDPLRSRKCCECFKPFHHRCIMQWMYTSPNGKCPMCRRGRIAEFY